MTRRKYVLWTVFVLATTVTTTSLAAEKGGRAARAAMFIGHAEPPAVASAVADVPASPTEFLVADAAIKSVPIFGAPGAVASTRSMKNPTIEGVRLIFGVLEDQGDWLKVMLPMRPNGSTGWVKREAVEIRKVSSRIVIDRSDRVLRAYRGDEPIFEGSVGVGTPKTPTPLAKAYVDISVPFPTKSGPYGVYMLSIAAYSEVLTNFGGGVGQLAIHGTANLGSIGKEASNGCIRLTNADILQLKEIAPTGTPVEIVA